MISDTDRLDSFQTALLAELRDDVTRSVTRREVGPPEPGPRVGRRWPLVAAAVSLVAGAGILIPALLGEHPAYAVVKGANGVVDVRVNRLEDAAGLEQALRRAGVQSDVRYLPTGTQCAPGRYVQGEAPDPSADFSFSLGSDGYRVKLAPGVISDNQTLVISVSRIAAEKEFVDGLRNDGGVSGSIGVAQGQVGPCTVVPDPD